jgi:hypothetical protein
MRMRKCKFQMSARDVLRCGKVKSLCNFYVKLQVALTFGSTNRTLGLEVVSHLQSQFC